MIIFFTTIASVLTVYNATMVHSIGHYDLKIENNWELHRKLLDIRERKSEFQKTIIDKELEHFDANLPTQSISNTSTIKIPPNSKMLAIWRKGLYECYSYNLPELGCRIQIQEESQKIKDQKIISIIGMFFKNADLIIFCRNKKNKPNFSIIFSNNEVYYIDFSLVTIKGYENLPELNKGLNNYYNSLEKLLEFKHEIKLSDLKYKRIITVFSNLIHCTEYQEALTREIVPIYADYDNIGRYNYTMQHFEVNNGILSILTKDKTYHYNMLELYRKEELPILIIELCQLLKRNEVNLIDDKIKSIHSKIEIIKSKEG